MKAETVDSSEFEAYLRNVINESANVIINNIPEMKHWILEALDLIFIPKHMASQVVLAVTL